MRLTFLLGVLLLFAGSLSAQDPYFMNVNQSLLALSPSFAGSNGGFRNQLSHSIADNGSNTRNNRKGVDLKIDALNAGIGFVINQDRVGAIGSTLQLGFIYAQYLPVYGGTHTFVPSFQISHVTRTIFNNPNFGGFGGGPSAVHADVSAGFLFNYSREFIFGAYWFHLNQPGADQAGGQVFSRYLFHMSYTIEMTKKDMLQIFYRSDMQGYNIKSQLIAHFLLARSLILNIGLDAKGKGCGGLGVKTGVFSLLIGYDASLPDYGYILGTNGRQNGNWEIHAALLICNKTLRNSMQPFEKM